jgi:pyruvate dehydrogenase phosphatase regulatory subunit
MLKYSRRNSSCKKTFAVLDKLLQRQTQCPTATLFNFFTTSNPNQNPESGNATGASSSSASSEVKFPLAAKVVICGGGLFGTSVAYHLAQLGYKDVILVTRNTLGSGTSFYSTGIVSIMRLSTSDTIFSKYSSTLYEKLQSEGHDIKYEKVGSIGLATSRDRWYTIKRLLSETRSQGIHQSLMSVDEIQEKFPMLRIDDVEVYFNN